MPFSYKKERGPSFAIFSVKEIRYGYTKLRYPLMNIPKAI